MLLAMTACAGNDVKISMVRHGEIHEEGFYYGRLPGSWLGESGQRQAQLVAEDLSGGHLAAVYHSPLLRTSQTAAAIAERHSGVARVCDDRLLEVKTPFDGCPMRDLEALGYDVYTGVDAPFEQPQEVLVRTLGFLTDVCKRHQGEHVVAVSHGDVILFLIAWGLGWAPATDVRGRLFPGMLPEPYPAWCSVTALDFRMIGGDWVLIGMSYRNPTAAIGENVVTHAKVVLPRQIEI